MTRMSVVNSWPCNHQIVGDELIIAKALSVCKLDIHQWYGCDGGTDMINEHRVDEVVRDPKVEQQQHVLDVYKYAQENRACRFGVGDGVNEKLAALQCWGSGLLHQF